MQIETRRQDLLELEDHREFDLVLVHGTLHFISADGRIDCLSRIRRALRPEGRLVLMFNTSQPSTVNIDDKFHIAYAETVLGELKRLRVVLPDNEATIRHAACGAFAATSITGGYFCRASRCRSVAEGCGYKPIGCTQVGVKLAGPAQNFVSHISKRRFMFYCQNTIGPKWTKLGFWPGRRVRFFGMAQEAKLSSL